MAGSNDALPYFAGLTFVIVALSFAIRRMNGEWPSDFGIWGTVLFAVVGVVLLGSHVMGRFRERRAAP